MSNYNTKLVCVCVSTWLGLDTEISDLDGKPYTTLLYGNGPGYAHTTPTGRHDLTGFNTEDINFVQQAAVPRKWVYWYIRIFFNIIRFLKTV